jgi:hypothetical protein
MVEIMAGKNTKYLYLTTICLCFIFPSTIFSDQITTIEGTVIDLKNSPSQQRFKILALLKALDRSSSMLFSTKTQKNAYPLKIMFLKSDAPKVDLNIVALKSGDIMVYIIGDFDYWSRDHNILKQLTEVMLLSKSGIFPDATTRLPSWLLTGILKETENKLYAEKIPGIRIYPFLNVMFSVEITSSIDYKKVFENPLSPSDGSAYLLYAELCEYLLDTIIKRKSNDQQIISFMKKLAESNPANSENVFLDTIGRNIYYKKTFKKLPLKHPIKETEKTIIYSWLNDNLRRKALNPLTPANAELSKTLFESAMLFPCEKPLKSEETKDKKKAKTVETFEVDITELPKLWGELKNKPNAIFKYKQKLARLRYEMDPSFHRSLDLLESALDKLKNKKPEEFKQNLAQAKIEFESAYKKRKLIENYLFTQNTKKVSPAQQYFSQFEIINIQSMGKEGFTEAVEDYLDKVDKEYNNR